MDWRGEGKMESGRGGGAPLRAMKAWSISRGLGMFSAKKILLKKLITWVILRGFFPSITHKKFMKNSDVIVKMSSGCFALLLFFA